jgi:hypothetical protein
MAQKFPPVAASAGGRSGHQLSGSRLTGQSPRIGSPSPEARYPALPVGLQNKAGREFPPAPPVGFLFVPASRGQATSRHRGCDSTGRRRDLRPRGVMPSPFTVARPPAEGNSLPGSKSPFPQTGRTNPPARPIAGLVNATYRFFLFMVRWSPRPEPARSSWLTTLAKEHPARSWPHANPSTLDSHYFSHPIVHQRFAECELVSFFVKLPGATASHPASHLQRKAR